MRDPEVRRASKRRYYERNKEAILQRARDRYARERTVVEPTPPKQRQRAGMGRDPERRKTSKDAYYTRYALVLRAKARQRMALRRATMGADARMARRLAHMSYRFVNHENLNRKRLNLYRKRWMLKNGVSRFLREFRGRAQAPQGYLAEHWDKATLESIIHPPPPTL
ncbi:hypothetical protein EV715DRAFT_297831 [Schizophyllum commune]